MHFPVSPDANSQSLTSVTSWGPPLLQVGIEMLSVYQGSFAVWGHSYQMVNSVQWSRGCSASANRLFFPFVSFSLSGVVTLSDPVLSWMIVRGMRDASVPCP